MPHVIVKLWSGKSGQQKRDLFFRHVHLHGGHERRAIKTLLRPQGD
jgi:hypothetical protein